MSLLLRRLTLHDPTAFVGAFAAWATCVGLGLLFTHDAFSYSPVWDVLRRINPNDTMWGLMFLIDGLLLFAALRFNTVPWRAAITLFSAILWFMIGLSCSYSGWAAGVFSINGPFSIWCAVQAGVAVERWILLPQEVTGGDK